MTVYKNILVPTDGSELSRKAARKAVNFARTLGAKVTAFHAAPPSTPIEYIGIFPAHYVAPQKHARLIAKAAAEHLGFIEKAAQKAGVTCKSEQVTSDFPADAILEAARRNKCDLIFMASHGRRGLKGLLMGSQAQKVMMQSKVPVLLHR